MSITPVKRKTIQHLINTKRAWEKTDTTDTWNLVNEGVTGLTESFNADTDDLQYIAEEDKTHVVKSYAPNIELTAVMVDGDPVNKWIRDVINRLPKNEEADTGYIRFNVLDILKTEGNKSTYEAIMRNAVVEVSSIGGEAGDNVEMEVTVSGKGEPIEGELVIDSTDINNKKYQFTSKNVSINKTIEFTVTDGSAPIADASVIFNEITMTTGADGKATFGIKNIGTYPFIISKDGKTSAVSNITVTASSPDKITKSITLASGTSYSSLSDGIKIDSIR